MTYYGLVSYDPWDDDFDFDYDWPLSYLGEDLFSPYTVWPEYGGYGRRRPGRRRRAAPTQQQQQKLLQKRGVPRMTGASRVTNDENQFKVALDVQHFKPEEINVKTDDKFVIVEGEHEERPDEHGYIRRHFVRKYNLPEGVKPEDVKCHLSTDGVLSIQAPKQAALEQGKKERKVQIELSPHPAVQPAQQAAVQQQQEGGKQQGQAGDKPEPMQ